VRAGRYPAAMTPLIALALLACQAPKGAPDTAEPAAVLDTAGEAARVVDQGIGNWPADLLLMDWIQTVWAYGVHRSFAASGDPAHQDYYRAWMDDALVDFTADEFVSSDSTSPSLMAATLMWERPDADYQPIVDAADQYVAAVPRADNGAVVHWGPDNPWGFPSDQVWVDTQFMLGLFWLRQWQRTEDAAYLDEFVAQYGAFSEVCRDPVDQLYRHAWDDSNQQNIPSEAAYWARGNAWVLVSGAELLRAVGPDSPAWDAIAPPWRAHVAAVLPLQADDGLWYTVLNEPELSGNYTETSASALIVYALAVGLEAGAVEDEGAVREAVSAGVTGVQGRISEDLEGTLHLTGTSTGTNPSDLEGYLDVPRIDDLMLGWGTAAMMLAEVDGMVLP
jgi:unsaturated rhamnogalacturonyl hydrolase